MYYLFIKKQKDIDSYMKKFNETKKNRENGKTPVFNEVACAKTNMAETIPYNMILGLFVVIGAILTDKIKINETVKIGVLLIINQLFGATCNFIFTMIKHKIRIRLCKRLGIEPTDDNIAVMESLEYQSV